MVVEWSGGGEVRERKRKSARRAGKTAFVGRKAVDAGNTWISKHTTSIDNSISHVREPPPPPPFVVACHGIMTRLPFLVKISFGFARPSPLSLSLSPPPQSPVNTSVKLRCSCSVVPATPCRCGLSCDHRCFRFDRQTPYNWYRPDETPDFAEDESQEIGFEPGEKPPGENCSTNRSGERRGGLFFEVQ